MTNDLEHTIVSSILTDLVFGHCADDVHCADGLSSTSSRFDDGSKSSDKTSLLP